MTRDEANSSLVCCKDHQCPPSKVEGERTKFGENECNQMPVGNVTGTFLDGLNDEAFCPCFKLVRRSLSMVRFNGEKALT